jgi:hypothetical protein
MHRLYNLAFVMLVFAIVPLAYLSVWLSAVAAAGAYVLAARLANKHLDASFQRRSSRIRPPKNTR